MPAWNPSSMRVIWLIIGHLALTLGVIGAFLPLRPTTPFLLLASFCYSKGSRRYQIWLDQHPLFGPTIKSWRESGIIRSKVKLLATFMIATSAVVVVFGPEVPVWAKVLALGTLGLALIFILTRPST